MVTCPTCGSDAINGSGWTSSRSPVGTCMFCGESVHRFATGNRIRLIGSPGFIGTVVRYYAPLPSGNVRVSVRWDRHGENGHLYSVLESQLEAIR